jgi:hypothetical protein
MGLPPAPSPKKPRRFGSKFDQLGLPLQIPDLNQGDFSHLSLTRQIHQVAGGDGCQGTDPTVLIGSSFGGLHRRLDGRASDRCRTQIRSPRPVTGSSLSVSGPVATPIWDPNSSPPGRRTGYPRRLPLQPAAQPAAALRLCHRCPAATKTTTLQQVVPTLVIHGLHDDVISVEASRALCKPLAPGSLW